jgi:hypothetical protein
MRKNQRVRMGVDCAMTVVLLLLMGYSRIGEMAHEWLGMLMFTLFVVHHILNRKWSAGLLRGNYTPLRVFQTVKWSPCQDHFHKFYRERFSTQF